MKFKRNGLEIEDPNDIIDDKLDIVYYIKNMFLLELINQMKFKGTKSYMNYLCSIPLIHSSPTNKIKCPFIYDIIVDKIDVNEDIDELYKPSEQINEDTVEEERENANEECKIIETERKSV